MNNKYFTVCGIVEIDGKILLVRHTYGTAEGRILVPGGYVEDGELIDTLLTKNAKRFGYLCTTIKTMGLKAISEFDNADDGFILIGDNRDGSYYLTLVSDNKATVESWHDRFDRVEEIQTTADISMPENAYIRNEYMYFGKPYEVILPESIEVHTLSVSDEKAILEWTKGKSDGYAEHLRNVSSWVNDERVLEYGIFRNGTMIGAVGCGIDSAHEFSLNNCINILLDERDDELYREVFMFITNDVMKQEIIPFDNSQYGEYADEHGGFSSEKMGYELVNKVICINAAL